MTNVNPCRQVFCYLTGNVFDSMQGGYDTEGLMQEQTGTQGNELGTVEMSRIRTRLANRRTFLAWVRTALSFMAFGFVLERLNEFMLTHKTLSTVAMQGLGTLGKFVFASGPLLVLFAGVRYYRLERRLGLDGFDKYIMPEILIVACFMAGALVYLLH